jgi:hypothetical protein
MCASFLGDPVFLQTLVVILDHTLRELVFYTVGIMINLGLAKEAHYLLQAGAVAKLVDVVRDANIEDMELAKVAGKALHNLMLAAR